MLAPTQWPRSRKAAGQLLAALGHPEQRAHWVAQGRRLHKTAQVAQHCRVRTAQPRPATTRAPHPNALWTHQGRNGSGGGSHSQLLRPAYDRASRNTRRPEHRHRPATPRSYLLRRAEQAPAPLVQTVLDGQVARADASFVDHPRTVANSNPRRNPHRTHTAQTESVIHAEHLKRQRQHPRSGEGDLLRHPATQHQPTDLCTTLACRRS